MSEKLNPYFGQPAKGPNGEEGLHYAGSPKATLGGNSFCLSENNDGELCIFMVNEKAEGQYDTPAGLTNCLGPDSDPIRDLENQAQAAQRHLLEKGRLDAGALNSSAVFVTRETRDFSNGGPNPHTFDVEVYLFEMDGCPRQGVAVDEKMNFSGVWIPLSSINPDVTGGTGSTGDRGYSFVLKDGVSGNIPIVYGDLITQTVKTYFNEKAQSAGFTLSGVVSMTNILGNKIIQEPSTMFGAEGKRYVSEDCSCSYGFCCCTSKG